MKKVIKTEHNKSDLYSSNLTVTLTLECGHKKIYSSIRGGWERANNAKGYKRTKCVVCEGASDPLGF